MAMSKLDLYQELEDTIACPLCLERCSQPRSLPCLHTYCMKCLNQLIEKSGTKGTFLCPSCRTEVKVPAGGATVFPDAFLWNTLSETADKLKQLGLHQQKPKCSLCLEEGKQSDSHSLCTDCMQTFCHHCLTTAHNRMMKNHHLLVLDELRSEDLNAILKAKPDYCQKHPEKNIEIFCDDCKQLACLKCAVLDHANHSKQELENVVDEHRKSLNNVHDKFAKRVQHYEQCLLRIDEQVEDCKVGIKVEMQKVDKQEQKMITHVKKCAKETKCEIQADGEKTVKRLVELKSTISLELSQLKNSMKHVATSLNHGNASAVIKSSTRGMQAYKKLLKVLKPNHNLPKLSLVIEFICPEELTKQSLIGEVQWKIESEPLGEKGEIRDLVATSTKGKLMANKVGKFQVPFQPRGVACTPDNNVIVCQEAGNQVNVYKPDGQILTQLKTPQGTVATDVEFANNSILVADQTTKSVLVFQTDGLYTRSINTGFKDYAGMCVENNKLFVTSRRDDKVYMLDWPSGANKQEFPQNMTSTNIKGPGFVAVTSHNVVISYPKNNTVLLYDRSGKLQFRYTGTGSHVKQLSWPFGVLIDSSNRLLVSDLNNHCVHILSDQAQFLGYIDILQNPVGLALNCDGHLVVAVRDSKTVATYQYTE